MTIQNQLDIFEEAKKSIEGLDLIMASWNFSDMFNELKSIAQKNKVTGDRNPIRTFCNQYLCFENQTGTQTYEQIRACLRGQLTISVDNIRLILLALKKSRQDLSNSTLPVVKQAKHNSVPDKLVQSKISSGMVRKVIDHTVGSFYSIVSLIIEINVKPEDVFGSDREQIQVSIEKVCKHFGITVKFPEIKCDHFETLTQEDLAGIGFRATRSKK